MSRLFADYVLRAKAILEGNRHGRITRPAPSLYPHQWNWDTGFIAIGLSRYDPVRAMEELRKSVAHPHRGFLISRIEKHGPFRNVLEIGCNAGQNLLLLARKFPQTEFYGIDINPRFIEAGKNFF